MTINLPRDTESSKVLRYYCGEPRSYGLCPVKTPGRNVTTAVVAELNQYFRGQRSYESICEILLEAGASQDAIDAVVSLSETQEQIDNSFEEARRINFEIEERRIKKLERERLALEAEQLAKEADIKAAEKAKRLEREAKRQAALAKLELFNQLLVDLENKFVEKQITVDLFNSGWNGLEIEINKLVKEIDDGKV